MKFFNFSKNVSFEIKNIIFSPIFDDSAVISSVISLLFLTHYIFSTFTGLFTGVDKFFVDPFGWFSGRLHFSLPDFFSSDDLSVSSPQPGQGLGLDRTKITQISLQLLTIRPVGLF